MLTQILKSKFTYIILAIYLMVLAFWLYLQLVSKQHVYYYYGFYSLISLTGATYGVIQARRKWGGFKSVIGKAVYFLSFGLYGQAFGLLAWTYYNIILKVEVPYPSIADVGYFALIPFYTLAAIMIAKAAGIKFSLRNSGAKLLALLIPFAMLSVAYWLFLKNAGVDTSKPLETFLNIGYPLGDAIPVSIVLLTLIVSSKILGGIMRGRLLWLMACFVVQFATDYLFLYQVAVGSFVDGGIVDLMYPTSHLLMVLGIIWLGKLELKHE